MIDDGAPRLKSGWRQLQHRGDQRTQEEITQHYLLERSLAERLRNASAESRRTVYNEVYKELFTQLPFHPRHSQLHDHDRAAKQVAVLKVLVPQNAYFLEIGAGDCVVSLAMADRCRAAIAVDVTEPAVAKVEDAPPNFHFKLTDGLSIPAASDTVDFVYSNQLMEHLHPGDAPRQLQEIIRVLRPGGCYFCITPTRLTGPHDVSRFFEDEARGFHLKEYTYEDIDGLFAEAGFGRLRACVTRGRYYVGSMPLWALIPVEHLFARVPSQLRQKLNANRWLRAALGLAVLAYKPDAS
jgi:SAM-dependent methyltransferase